jgi:hypothetical protein
MNTLFGQTHWNSDILPPHCGQTKLMIDEMICAFDSPGSVSAVSHNRPPVQRSDNCARGRHGPQTTEIIPRGSFALSGAPNWLAAKSVSPRWLPPR